MKVEWGLNKEGKIFPLFYMKTPKIINFSGMDFRQERAPSMRLRRKIHSAPSQQGRMASNLRNVFNYLRGV